MTKERKIYLPDIGNFPDVKIIEIEVAVGDKISKESTLITLESDKATLDIPSPFSGKIKEILVSVGSKVSKGSLLAIIEKAENKSAYPQQTVSATVEAQPSSVEPNIYSQNEDLSSRKVVVLGGGPGGYSAAFRLADLGKKVVLVERYPNLGGVCLNVGCIPSKTLLHISGLIQANAEMKAFGIDLGKPNVTYTALRSWNKKVITRLTNGLSQLAKQRGVRVVQGIGRLTTSDMLTIESDQGTSSIAFTHAVLAAGSHPIKLACLPDHPHIFSATGALALRFLPKHLVVIGGGIIGLEMATVYHALGVKITLIEATDSILSGCDRDVVRPLKIRLRSQYAAIYCNTRVTGAHVVKKELEVLLEGANTPKSIRCDAVLVAVGRRPNKILGVEEIGIHVNSNEFIKVNEEQRTNIKNIFAIGDLVGQPMLAHKATHEGKVAAEVIVGLKRNFAHRLIPSVAYTNPEVAWVGINETEAQQQRIDYKTAIFPWSACGRALSIARTEGLTKLIFEKGSDRLLGAAISGMHAGELISECTLALEMGCNATDLAMTIHPHPTLSETTAMAAELYEGTIPDLYLP